jgi:anti-sigma factor RsiW
MTFLAVTGRRRNKMKCDEFKDKTDTYLERELSKDESIEFENHLRSCLNCRTEMESIKKGIDLLRNIFSDKTPPPEIKKKVFEKACCDEEERKTCCPPEDES